MLQIDISDLRERVSRGQIAGMIFAFTSVAMIAAG